MSRKGLPKLLVELKIGKQQAIFELPGVIEAAQASIKGNLGADSTGSLETR